MCVIIDSLGGEAATVWFDMCVIINLLDVVIYSGVWVTLKFKAGASDAMKRVFRSLLVIMVLVVCGWMLNAFVRSILLPYAGIPVSQWFFWASYFGMCANVASSSNVFVLYLFRYVALTTLTFKSHLYLSMVKAHIYHAVFQCRVPKHIPPLPCAHLPFDGQGGRRQSAHTGQHRVRGPSGRPSQQSIASLNDFSEINKVGLS